MMSKVFITGATGQCGSYLSEMCLNRGDKVYAFVRRTSTPNDSRINHLLTNPNFEVVQGDVTDASSLARAIGTIKPDYAFGAAAQSHVHVSFNEPLHSFAVTSLGCVNTLEAIRIFSPLTKFLQFSTSELFGYSYDERVIGHNEDGSPIIEKYQDETTRKLAQSPYAAAKLGAHEMVRIYRSSYKLFTSAAIFMNMESPRRTETFVTRKITRYVGKLVAKCVEMANLNVSGNYVYKQEQLQTFPKLKLGNLDAARDWQHCKEAMRAALMILDHTEPDDFLVASGVAHTIREFLTEAFELVGLDWKNFVETDSNLLRPSEVNYLKGDPSKIKRVLGWEYQGNFKDLVKEMVSSDIDLAIKESK